MSPLLYRTAIAVGAVLVIVVVSLVVFQPRRGAVKRRIAERVERVERAEQMAVEQARAQKEAEREALQEQAGIARLQREEAEREELAHEKQQRLAAEAERDLEGRRRRAAEQAQRERERRKVEQERLDAAHEKAEEEHRLAAEMQLQREAEEQAEREKRERKKAAEAEATALAAQASDELDAEKEDDDTPEVETDSTIDNVEARRGWRFSGDLRPIYDAERDEADGGTVNDANWGVRWRVGAEWGIIKKLRAGARLAGICSIDDCDPDFVMQTATPGANGLLAGQITIDQLYLHGFRKGRFDVAVGRLQTRFVLRGGVYAKSLDRNDSNNVNVTWTDGMHATVRGLRGWATHFVLQRNASDGTGSIRRGLLDFDDESARNTYFVGTENIGRWGSGRSTGHRRVLPACLAASRTATSTDGAKTTGAWSAGSRCAGLNAGKARGCAPASSWATPRRLRRTRRSISTAPGMPTGWRGTW